MRKLTESEVEFSVIVHPEYIPVEGNASAWDEETDKAAENWIYEQLESGNEWAWCTIEVKAEWNGFSASDYLGCCSYAGEKDFMHDDGYYPDMKSSALQWLNDELESMGVKLDELQD